jgi:phage virion morphogenesis protein
MAQVTIKDRGLKKYLGKFWRKTLSDLTPLKKRIGAFMVGVSKQSWRDRADPATGHPWAPLSPKYKAWKIAKGYDPEPLVLTNRLRKSIHDAMTGRQSVTAGTDATYGPKHQFGISGGSAGRSGGELSRLPARPFLGLSDRHQDEIKAMCARWISEGK